MRPEWGFVKIIGSRMHQVCLFDAASDFKAGIKMNPLFFRDVQLYCTVASSVPDGKRLFFKVLYCLAEVGEGGVVVCVVVVGGGDANVVSG